MTGIFVTVLNMSIMTSFIITLVVFLRLILKKMPRIFSYCLWLVVFLRLLLPFSLEMGWGIIPSVNLMGTETGEITASESGGRDAGMVMPDERTADAGMVIEDKSIADTGMVIGYDGLSGGKAAVEKENLPEGISPEKLAQGFAGVWMLGFALLLFYGIFSYIRFAKVLADGVKSGCGQEKYGRKCITDGKYTIMISEDVKAPFVAGFLKPVIYLPQGLDGVQSGMVCAHEKIHIVRRDYLVKPTAALAVCIHWFNPLVWLAFYLMEQDMEVSCDEAVLKRTGDDSNKTYARTLLVLSREYSWKAGCPIAFGENSVKTRIKNAVRYKKAKPWMLVAGAAGILAAAALLFVNSRWELVISLTDRQAARDMPLTEDIAGEGSVPGTDANTEEIYLYSDENPGNQIIGEEKSYLPSERIAYTQPNVLDNGVTSRTEHYYYMNEDAYSENQPDDGGSPQITETGDNEPEYEAEKMQDDYAILLRSSEGAHDMTALKYAYPLEYERISDDFGVRIHPVDQTKRIHSGMDFAAKRGTPVKAAAAGTVFETGMDTVCGNYVIIQHSNGDMTYYANCEEILAETGAEVEQGEQIATVGSTGMSTGSHLHYALSRNGEFVRPEFAG